jgi:hypothetical protein
MKKILLYILAIAVMIGLIPLIQNDFILTGVYLVFIAVTLSIRREKNDWIFLVFGFVGLFCSEYFFISTGVETFNRHTLFGVMPVWLPFLWSYAFMIIGRCIRILDK